MARTLDKMTKLGIELEVGHQFTDTWDDTYEIIHMFITNGGMDYVVLRDVNDYEDVDTYTFGEISKEIREGSFKRVKKPLFKTGDMFELPFSDQEIKVLNVSDSPEGDSGEYIYFVEVNNEDNMKEFGAMAESKLVGLPKTQF